MKVKILKVSKPEFWYKHFIGETRSVKIGFMCARHGLKRWFKYLMPFIEDKKLSKPGIGYKYWLRDIKFIWRENE